MRVQIRRNRKSLSVIFRAGADPEGVDLKDAVMAAALDGFTPARVIEELGKRGYRGGITRTTDRAQDAVLERGE